MGHIGSSGDNNPLVVFVIDKPLSHLYSSMALARELQKLGCTVEYWGSTQILATVSKQRFTFREIDAISSRYPEDIRIPKIAVARASYPGQVLKNIRARRERLRGLPVALDRVQRSVDRLISNRDPKLVIFDPFLLAYFPFFWSHGIQGVVLSTKPLPIPDPGVPPYCSYVVPRSTAVSRLLVKGAWLKTRLKTTVRRGLIRILGMLSAYTYEDLIRQVASRVHFDLHSERLERWIQPDLSFRSVHEWAFWTAEMDLPRQFPLPHTTHYIGPLVDFERALAPCPVERDPAKRYLIYVSVGTIRPRWREYLKFLRKVVNAFADDEDVLVVISTGSDLAKEAIGTTPAHIQTFDFLPQLSLLKMADLAITHGGAGTLRECVLIKVPMLVYPNHHDQMGNSARVIYHGIGLRGSKTYDSPKSINAKARRILEDPLYRANLNELHDTILKNQHPLLLKALREVGFPSSSLIRDLAITRDRVSSWTPDKPRA